MTNTAAAPAVFFQLRGDPWLHAADGTAHPLERKDAALLALLALEGPVPRAKAAALLWPDVDDEAARNNLRQRLHRLRKRAGFDFVHSVQDMLHLADSVQHDASATAELRLNGSPRAAPTDPSAAGPPAPRDLLGALDFADCAELHDWISMTREQQRAAWRDALADTAARLERDGQLASALRYAEQLVADDPLLEHAHRRVMRLHYLRGDRAAALATFKTCRETLQRELRVAPGRETLELCALIEASGALPRPAGAPIPVAVLRPPRLIGREAEWRVLEQTWSARRVALVSGEPGIGKTRLLTDFAAVHGDVIVVGGRPGDAHVPYTLLARLLRSLRTRVGTSVEPWALHELARLAPEFDPGWTAVGDVNRARLAQAVQLLLAAAGDADAVALGPEAPRLGGVVVDDLQFADAESIEMLTTLMRSDALDLAWLIGARSHELPAAAQKWLAASGAAGAMHVDLAPLDLEHTRLLLETLMLVDFDAARWVDAVYRHTGGNPMFVLETMVALLAPGAGSPVPHNAAANAAATPEKLPIPASVGQLIEARLAQLSTDALKLARVAALANKDFDLELAADVLNKHVLDLAEPWSELERTHIIREAGFAHDLIYEATLRSIPAAVAMLTHKAIAISLEQRDAAAEHIAPHWHAAGAWSKAAQVYLQAAQIAYEHSRRSEELILLRRAAECLERSRQIEGRFQIELRSAHAALLIDRTDQAHDFAERALVLAPDSAARAEALAVLAEAADFMNEGDAAIEQAAEGLRLAVALAAPALVLTLAALLGRLRATRGDFEQAVAAFDDHEHWLERGTGTAAARTFLAHRAVVMDQARQREEAVTVALHALRLATEARDWSNACLCHANLGSFYLRLGSAEDGIGHLRQALRLGDQLGEVGGKTELARVYLGNGLLKLGKFREALEALSTAHTRLALGKAMPWAIIAQNILARAYVVLGQPERGWKLLEGAPDELPPAVLALLYINQARVLRAMRRPRGHLIADALALHALQKQHETDLLAYLEQAIDSESAEGAELAARAEADAATRMHHPLRLDAQIIGCACLLKAGAVELAAAKAHAMLAMAEKSCSWTQYRGSLYWNAFEALDANRETESALDALHHGVAWINSVLPSVPDAFNASFLERNPVNRALLSTASRRLHA